MIENHRMVSFVVVIFIFTPRLLYSQAFTLQQCMEIAGNDNKSINIADENRIQKQWEFQQAKSTFVPSINISNQHNISTGRVLDPTTYQFLTHRFNDFKKPFWIHPEGFFLVFELQKNAPKLHQSVTRPYLGRFCGEAICPFWCFWSSYTGRQQ